MLIDDLITEAIQINGHDVYYLPRGDWEDVDTLYGENVNSKFERAYQMEMYINNVEGFLGDQDFFSKFGLEIRDNANFVVGRQTFEKYVPANITYRPREGDLIWVPVMNRIFEVKFVEEESHMFAIGNKLPYVYELRCELFRYSNEEIATGVEEIDTLEDDISYTVQMVVSGTGDFQIGETVYQSPNTYQYATMTGTVSDWDAANTALYLVDIVGEISDSSNLIGVTSGTQYSVTFVDLLGDYVYWDNFDNKLIQDEANNFVDLTESNPFGVP